jgi:predicted Zn-dependent protease
MRSHLLKPSLSSISIALLAGFLSLSAVAQSQLPSLGDRISGTVSLDDEYQMGQQFLSQLRRSAPTIPDALLNDYLENVTYKVASRSQLKDHRLSFVVIDSEDLNAFAAPGGIIGVNTGLFLNAQTEAEFVSVMAHEIAHVSQRHFARTVDEAQAGSIPQIATMLASILIMATSDAGHGQAAIAAAQGRSVENQLRFSRNNEAEADRVGQDTMFAAGFNPNGMSALFERLVAINRFGRRPPEFLLTHPVTESRVADARGRAVRYPLRNYADNLEYQVVRSRVLGHYANDKEAYVSQSKNKLQQSLLEFDRDAARYNLAIAYYENKEYNLANATLAPLLEKDPNQISYVATQAEFYTEQNEPAQAIQFLQRHMEINPDNHALVMAYIDALIEMRAFSQAAETMLQHALLRPDDHNLWFKLADTQGQAGNISAVHQSRAEFFRLIGDYRSSREQLKFAVRIETEKGSAPAELARLKQKIRDVEQMQRDLND